MEHSLHIACKHFVEAIAPASPATIRKKVKDALENAWPNGELDLHQFGNDLNLENNGEPEDNEGEDAEVEFSSGDALGKALALVKQVHIHGIS
jgi:hypothetical protein